MGINELKNGCVYVCMKGVIKQMFMYTNTAKDDEHAYSLLIEYTPDAKYPYVYCRSVGPKLTLEDLRKADLKEIADFFAEAQKNDYAYNRKNKKWTSAVDADIVIKPKHTVRDTVDNRIVSEIVNEPVKQQNISDFDGLNPHLFTYAIDAADTIDADDDRQYIIIVPMSADKAEVTLTDDPHSILHSCHLKDKEVIVYGPVKKNYFANVSDAFLHYKLV